MTPSIDIVDRDEELKKLRSLLGRGVPALVLMYGRRRVGKTFLLSRAWPRETAFYFTASETTPAQNREALLRAFAEWSGEEIYVEDFPTWRSVFRLLLDYETSNPLVIVVDEYQYLGESPNELQAVSSELNAAWEARRPERPILFILAGSAVRTLESLNEGGSPLYGRFAWQVRLRPFNYFYAGRLTGFNSARDQAVAYGAFGGIPRYVASIDPAATVSENIIDLMLHPSGEVRELVQTALHQEQGLRSIPKYIAILRAIGLGRTELNDIAQAAGLEADRPLRDKLERLISLDYIQSSRNIGASPTEAFRYRLSDPALRFYYAFVAPLESALATQHPAAVWNEYISPRMDTYMGLIFERMVEEAYYHTSESRDLPVVREWGRWEGRDRNRNALEIDIVAPLLDKRVLTGAIKWNRRPVDVDVHTNHLIMLDRLAESGAKWAHTARDPASPLLYAAAGGFTDAFKQAALASRPEVYLLTLDDLYRA